MARNQAQHKRDQAYKSSPICSKQACPSERNSRVPPPESLYIGSSSPDGGSVFSNVIVSHPSIQIPHVKKTAATRFQAAKSQAPKTPRTDTILPEHLLAHTLITYVYSHYCIWSFCHHFPRKNDVLITSMRIEFSNHKNKQSLTQTFYLLLYPALGTNC